MSTKKEELLAILDHCSVQIDNPVSILSQDTSRNFLQKATPSDKYKLFMKATQLEQIATDYEKASEDQKLMQDGIKRQELVGVFVSRCMGVPSLTPEKNEECENTWQG